MLAFTRHERLDVKKPGPPAEPPPVEHQPNKTPDLSKTPDLFKTPEQPQSQPANLLETQLHYARGNSDLL